MKRMLKVSFCVLFLFFTSAKIYTQVLSDTTIINNFDNSLEEIVFEDDTIVLPSDTIRITDTITIAEDSVKKNNTRTNTTLDKFFFIPSKNIKHFMFLQFSAFMSNQNFSAKLADSIQYPKKQPINYYYCFQYGIQLYKWLFKIGPNFLSISEKSLKKNIFIKESVSETNLRTLKETVEVTNYFYYMGLSFDLSYNINVKNFNLYPELNIVASKLFSSHLYKIESGTTISIITDNELLRYLKLVGVSLPVDYELKKNISVFVKPSIMMSINSEGKFPLTLKYAFSLGLGLKYGF